MTLPSERRTKVNRMRYFITGTDTGAGKTFFSCLLLRALVAAGKAPGAFKPVSCGDRHDARALAAASASGSGVDLPDLDLVNPVHYRHPLSPAAAALMENRPFPWAVMRHAWATVQKSTDVIVEGAGGWLVPVDDTLTMADIAVELGLPVLVVVNNKLGALNHTLLTVQAIRNSGLTCAGIVLNHPGDERDSASISNPAVLRAHLAGVPLLAELLHGEEELPSGVLDALG